MTNVIQRLALLGLILFFGGSSWLWIRENSRPPGPDTSSEIRVALAYSHPLEQRSFSGFRDVFIHNRLVAYPPLEFILIGTQFALLHPSIDGAPLANLFWMALFCLAAYALGSRYFSPATGLVAIVLTLTMVIVTAFIREVSMEIALMALVTLFIYLLLRTENFSRLGWSLALGATAALGLWVKESFPIYVFVPSLWVLFQRPRSISKKTLMYAAVAVGICAGIAAWWYVPHWPDVKGLYDLNRRQAVVEKDPAGWNLAAALYYPNALVNYYLHPLLAILLVAAIFRNWVKTSAAGRMILVCLGGAYFLLTFAVANKDVRHLVPVAPAIAFLVADWMAARAAAVRKVLTVTVLVVSAIYFLGSQWGMPPWNRVIHLQAAGYDWRLWDGDLFKETVPHRENWHIPELIDALRGDAASRHPARTVRVGVVPFVYRFNAGTLACYGDFQGLKAEFTELGNESSRIVLSGFDYVITKSGDQGAASLTTQSESINRYLESSGDFKPLASFLLYDGTPATILKRE